jgi:hypothetical protein
VAWAEKAPVELSGSGAASRPSTAARDSGGAAAQDEGPRRGHIVTTRKIPLLEFACYFLFRVIVMPCIIMHRSPCMFFSFNPKIIIFD